MSPTTQAYIDNISVRKNNSTEKLQNKEEIGDVQKTNNTYDLAELLRQNLGNEPVIPLESPPRRPLRNQSAEQLLIDIQKFQTEDFGGKNKEQTIFIKKVKDFIYGVLIIIGLLVVSHFANNSSGAKYEGSRSWAHR
jgi:hypothetical protein